MISIKLIMLNGRDQFIQESDKKSYEDRDLMQVVYCNLDDIH